MANILNLIKKTEAYKKLSLIQKEITLKRQNRLVIENGFEVAKNIGFEQWEKHHNFSYINKNIVKELIENHTK